MRPLVSSKHRRRGSTQSEYALLIALVSVGTMVALTAFADAASDLWLYVSTVILAAI